MIMALVLDILTPLDNVVDDRVAAGLIVLEPTNNKSSAEVIYFKMVIYW